MASFTSKATNNWNVAGQITWNEPGFPDVGDDATIQSPHTVTQVFNANSAGIVVNNGGTLVMGEWANNNTGSTSIIGTLTMGTSSGTGLTTTGLSFVGSVGSADLQKGSEILNNGAYEASVSVFASNYTGTYTHTTSSTYANTSTDNLWESFTLQDGATITSVAFTAITAQASDTTVVNGVINSGANSILLGGDGVIVLGANSDFIGSDTLEFRTDGATFTNNKSGTFSWTGTVQMTEYGSTGSMLTGDFRNADYELDISISSATVFTFLANAGTAANELRAKGFLIDNSSTGQVTIANNTNNPALKFSGDIDLNGGSGSYTTVYNASSQPTELTGTNQSIDLNGQTFEKIYSTGNIGNVTILSADTWDFDTLDLTATNLTVNGTLKGAITSGTGLTVTNLTFASGSTRNFNNDTKVTISGNYTCADEDLSTNNTSGIITITGNGNYISPDSDNAYEVVTLNDGVTITCTGETELAEWNSDDMFINGIVATNGQDFTLGGNLTFGVNSDITGNGLLQCKVQETNTVTYNKAGAFSFTGTVRTRQFGSRVGAITGDWSNADYLLQVTFATAITWEFMSGTLKCKNFSLDSFTGATPAIDNTVNNPNFEISGDYNLNLNSETAPTYSKGTGSIKWTGTNQSINLQGLTVEEMETPSSIGNVTILAGDTWTIKDATTFRGTTINVLGTLELPAGVDAAFLENITGNGTIISKDPVAFATVLFTGANTFTGTLTRVDIVPYEPSPRQLFGNRVNQLSRRRFFIRNV